MTLTPQEYQKTQENEPYRDQSLQFIPMRDLEAHGEHLRNLAVEFGEDVRAGGNRAVLEVLIDSVDREVSRRRRLCALRPDDPLIPKSTPKAVDTEARIKAVKAIWPALAFCEEVLGVQLQRSSRDRWKSRCPLPNHDDGTPSFVVYEATESAWCFGCQRGGDVIALAGHYFGYERFFDQLECVERLSGINHAAIVTSIHSTPAPVQSTAERFIGGRWVS